MDELHSLWDECVDLQTTIVGSDLDDRFSKENFVLQFRAGVSRLYDNVLDDCAGRLRRHDTPVTEGHSETAGLHSPEVLARLAEALPRRVGHLTRTLRRSLVSDSFDLAGLITAGCLELYAKDVERLLLQYLETSTDGPLASSGVDPVFERQSGDADLLRLVYALASLCRTWSLGGSSSASPATRLFQSFLSRILKRLERKLIGWLSKSFNESIWGDGIQFQVENASVSQTEPKWLCDVPIMLSESLHDNSASNFEQVFVPLPNCYCDLVLGISKCVTFVNDALELLQLEGGHQGDIAQDVAELNLADSWLNQLAEVVCSVVKSFMLRIVEACVVHAEIDLLVTYKEFCNRVNFAVECSSFAQLFATVDDVDSGDPTTKGTPAGESSRSFKQRSFTSAARSPLNSQQPDYDDDLCDIESFGIASPLQFAESTIPMGSALAAPRHHVEIGWVYPWNTLDLDSPKETKQFDQPPRGKRFSDGDLQSKIKGLWGASQPARHEMLTQLNTLSAIVDSFSTLPLFLTSTTCVPSSSTRDMTFSCGQKYVAHVADLGYWAYAHKIIGCVKPALIQLFSATPCGERVEPDKEESFVRGQLRVIGRFFQDEILEASRALTPDTLDSAVKFTLSELYSAFSEVCMQDERFIPVEPSTAHRVRRCALFCIGVFERMPFATVPKGISRQFAELVEVLEMYTTPTVDLAYEDCLFCSALGWQPC